MSKGLKTFVEAHIAKAHQKMTNISTKRRKEDEKYMKWKKYVIHFDGMPNGEDLENKPIYDSCDCNINIDFCCSN